MIVDPLSPIMVKTAYRAAEDQDGNELRLYGRRLYMHVSTCPTCCISASSARTRRSRTGGTTARSAGAG